MTITLGQALLKSDTDWYRELFKDYELKRLPPKEVASIITSSMASAELLWNQFQVDYDAKGPRSLLQRYGVSIHEQMVQTATNLLAFYDVDRNSLQLQSASIDAFHKRIRDAGYGQLMTIEDLTQMVLTHELYHVLEMNEADVYTYQKIIPRKFLFFNWSERLKSAGEVGAYHFTKLAMRLNFPPQFLEEL